MDDGVYLQGELTKSMDGQFNYIIKYRDINDLTHEYKWQLEELQKGIEKMKDKINAFINDNSFKGEGADSIKAYFRERHIPMLDGINQAAQSLLDNVATYKGSYYNIDFATNFILNKESIESYNSVLYKKYTDETDGYIDAAKAALNSVSDIFSDYIYPQEAANNIDTYHEAVKTRINEWTPQIQNVEYNTAYLVHQVTDAFINVIDQTNKSIGTDWADIKKYESGSLDNNVCFNSLKEISSIYNDIHNQNADVYDKIWDVERQLDEAAAQREAQGAMKIISGIGLAITGVVCIVATWGAATPVVVAGVVAGGGTLAFAAADTVEGAQDVYYGSIGDIDSTSFNGIKSLVYACGGDDDDYNNIEQAFSFAASCMAPIGTASKMGTLTTETVITTIAKEYISNEAGNLAQEITVKLTDNQIAGLVANVVASAATSKGLDALDKPVNVDIGIDADNAKSVKTGDVDGIKPVDADIKTNVSADLPGAGAAGKVDDFAGAAGKVDDLSGVAGKVDDLSGTGKAPNISDVADNVKPTSVETVDYGDQFTRANRKKVLKPNVEYTTPEGYTYRTDQFGNIVEVKGQLELGSGHRNQYAQSNVGGADRLATDDGGHLIASQFKGSGNIDNLVPMDSDINRAGGKWYNMEKTWSDALKETPPRTVEVDIKPIYDAGGARPTAFRVKYSISGIGTEVVEILNKAGG